MREFRGEAARDVKSPIEDCFALLAAVDAYPDWCPDIVGEVEVLERGPGDQPSKVRMKVHIERGPIVREFDLFLAIVVEPPKSVRLTRATDHPTEQEFEATWLLDPAGSSTRIAIRLAAKLRVPSYIPAGGVGDMIAEAFVSAASRALAAGSAPSS
jgi:ribosome-associated toxin RatA of RatAB toxin-antitoxin module